MGSIGYVLGSPKAVVIISGIVMLTADTALLIGFKNWIAAIILFAVLIPITLTIQLGQVETMGPLFKNVAILGSFLFSVLIHFQIIKINEQFKYKKW